MATITSQNTAQAIIKLVAAKYLDALIGAMVMGGIVNRDYEDALAQAGDTINVPIPPVLVANSLSEGGSVTPQTPSLGNAQIILNQHPEATVTIPDATKVLAVPDLLKIYMDPAVNAIAESIETSLMNLYTNFTVNAAVGGATAVDEARIDLAETNLFKQKVPKTQPKFLIVNAGTYGALRQLPRFTDWQNLGPNSQPSAQITGTLPGGVADGRIKDFWVYRSQFIAQVSGTTYNMAFARDGIGIAMRKLPPPLPGTGAIAEYLSKGGYGLRVIMSYQSGSLSNQFTVDCLYGCAVFRNSFGLQVQTNN